MLRRRGRLAFLRQLDKQEAQARDEGPSSKRHHVQSMQVDDYDNDSFDVGDYATARRTTEQSSFRPS